MTIIRTTTIMTTTILVRATTTTRMASATMPAARCNGRRRMIRPPGESAGRPEPDFDLVEAAFVSGFSNAPDPTSFLRLARIPFEGQTAEGETLQLLRVETDEAVDVASLTAASRRQLDALRSAAGKNGLPPPPPRLHLFRRQAARR